jgi:hypothetical protein
MDFVVSRPASPKAPASRRGKAKKGSRFAWLRFLGRRPARTILGAAFSAVLVGIAINALFFQTARHPAPLMAETARKPVTAAPVPAPPARPAQAAPSPAPALQTAAAASPKPAAVAKEPSENTAAKSAGDPIGALIRGSSPSVAAGDMERERVHAAQRALIRLGYNVKADGVIGSSTRQAIEKFERDRNIRVTGELSPRTVRELATQSRIAIP